MKPAYHPGFAHDINRHAAYYGRVSMRLAGRFRNEVDDAIDAIAHAPKAAGHRVNVRSPAVQEIRRRNLRRFPFFVLYAIAGDRVYFASLIPKVSHPRGWLVRLK